MPRLIVGLLTAVTLSCVGLAVSTGTAAAPTTVVPPGGDAQAAITASNHGDEIRLTNGVYPVSLDITKSITITGHKSILVPPPSDQVPATPCNQHHEVSGICIHGDDT